MDIDRLTDTSIALISVVIVSSPIFGETYFDGTNTHSSTIAENHKIHVNDVCI